MMQITKRIQSVYNRRKAAESYASQGLIEASDEQFIDAYMNARDLIDSYSPAYFTDGEYNFLLSLIEDFENE